MMSKLYKMYEQLKLKDLETIYLFLCGNFYIALDSDAIILNEVLNLKLTKFSNICDKCGFPINSLTKYEGLLKEKNISYKIIDNIVEKSLKDRLNDFINSSNINNLNKEEIIEKIKEIIVE